MRVVLALLVALTVPALGWQGPEGTATVRGRVVDAVTGRPLRNLPINFYPQHRGPYAPGIDAEPPKRTAITDDGGAFEVPRLVAAAYVIMANSPAGYLGISYGSSRPGGPSRNLRVTDGAQLEITIRAWRAATIAGHVYDERGVPVIGAQVRVFEKELEVYGSGSTDDRGAYEISRLVPGQYAVGVPVSLSSRTLSAKPPRQAAYTPALPPYVLDRGLRTVLLVQGVPLAPATENGRAQVYTTAFAGGASTKETALYMRVEAGDVRENIDITLPARRGTRVSGIVTAAADVTGTILALLPEGSGRDTDAPRIDATVAADGTFVFAATPPGKYVLTGYRRRPPLTEVTLGGGSPAVAWDDVIDHDPDDMWAEMPLSVGDADIDNLAISLVAGTELTGRVVLENQSDTRRPLRTQITLATEPRISLDDRQLQVQPDGSISTRIRPGTYRLLANSEGREFKALFVNGRDIENESLVVGSEPLRDVQVVFDRFDTALQGTVVEGDGTPSTDATVMALPADRRKWYRLETSGRVKIVRVSSGAYRLSGLAPGEYFVVALHDFPGMPSQRDAAAYAAIANRIDVRTGQPATLNLVARDRE